MHTTTTLTVSVLAITLVATDAFAREDDDPPGMLDAASDARDDDDAPWFDFGELALHVAAPTGVVALCAGTAITLGAGAFSMSSIVAATPLDATTGASLAGGMWYAALVPVVATPFAVALTAFGLSLWTTNGSLLRRVLFSTGGALATAVALVVGAFVGAWVGVVVGGVSGSVVGFAYGMSRRTASTTRDMDTALYGLLLGPLVGALIGAPLGMAAGGGVLTAAAAGGVTLIAQGTE